MGRSQIVAQAKTLRQYSGAVLQRGRRLQEVRAAYSSVASVRSANGRQRERHSGGKSAGSACLSPARPSAKSVRRKPPMQPSQNRPRQRQRSPLTWQRTRRRGNRQQKRKYRVAPVRPPVSRTRRGDGSDMLRSASRRTSTAVQASVARRNAVA